MHCLLVLAALSTLWLLHAAAASAGEPPGRFPAVLPLLSVCSAGSCPGVGRRSLTARRSRWSHRAWWFISTASSRSLPASISFSDV